ncbi:MAG: FimV/HubP family polar landmark protein [Gammaproteobacteria bacterium]|nr:FimV/HubP family polar landmark protein [Gammaproteobacteria bacterium]
MLAGCRKFFAMLSLIAGCFHACNVLAVGLGDLEVNSSLSEPLDATIQLLGLEGLDETQIRAVLGTPADFERANMERVGLIDDILMEVIVFDADQGLLLLTSDEPVEEPFLSMVISLRWPNGRLLRDYTALIDLPLFISDEPETVPVDIPETPAPVQQPRTLSSADIDEGIPGTPEPTEAEPTQAASNEVPADVVEELVEDDTVVIQSGDTLYDIAARSRPDTSVSVEQTMLAIQRYNPDAFIDNDINRIRVGQVMRIPSIQDIASIDQTQALNQIALQNQAATTQPLALSDNDPAGTQQGPDELTILGGDEGTNTLSGDSDLAESIAALENQLAVSEENLDRARLENEELWARYTELEDQIEILQNIIAMQDERLAQLQANLAASPTEIEEPVAAQPVVNNVQTPQTDDSLMGQLSSVFENTLVLVASLIGLILLVVGFLVWRRQAALDVIDEFDLGGAAVASGSEAFDTEEPDGASAGFLAAIKSRFSHDEDVSDDSVDEYAEDDNEEGGLLARLKGIFSRSSDDGDDFHDDVEDDVQEEDKGEAESEESATEDLDGLDEQEDKDEEENEDTETALAFDDEEEDVEDEAVDDFNDESVSEESEEESVEEIEDSADDDLVEEALLDDSDNDLEIDVDDEVEENEDAELSESEEPEQDIVEEESEDISPIDEPVEAAAEESGDILDISDDDLDLGDFGDDDSEDISIGEVGADAEVDEVTETAEETEEPATQSESEEAENVETFDFALDDTEENTETSEETVEEAKVEDVESFDFSLDESTPEPADETEDAPQEDVESFDFNVDESPATAEESAQEATETDVEAGVETLEFDVSAVSSFEEESKNDTTEIVDADVIELDEGEEIAAPVDEEISLGAQSSAEDPLTAALEEIDAEAEQETDSDDSSADDDGDLDFGNIDIDDSLSEEKASEEVVEPITDRDESSTKLDLAVAYEAMGDLDGANEILNEVIKEGNEEQIAEAKKLLEKWEQS